MARTRDGVSTILHAARIICRMVGLFGTSSLAAKTTPALAAAVETMVAACRLFEATDDYPYAIDTTAPFGPEDTPPA